ncbi:Phosphoribosyl-ATP pyrophosphohydrolase-like [uncultured Caudovirales phage]|uniref:Phosphoribosyl-ATP pyrophosphohydrolase-like n=1 Tax=uncultured Caudovirales phage TaxID=2100421 RepID=A0A6J5Q105_9CAUD|nr:Phosphoribosyl-ATP pyrophosphohydrolase-like [uncultured Caudovirales phage]
METTGNGDFPVEISLIDESVGGMTTHAKRVALFAIRGGQSVPSRPTMPDTETLRLRCLLLLEESLEFFAAAGFELDLYTMYSPQCRVGERFGYSLYETDDVPSYEGMVDACADVSVVNTGTLIALGAGDVEVLETVDKCNLSKVSGDVKRDANGKILKPAGWSPPVYGCVTEYELSAGFGNGIQLAEEGVHLQ